MRAGAELYRLAAFQEPEWYMVIYYSFCAPNSS